MLTALGGKEVMLEIPFLDEIVMEKTHATACETARQDIVTVLEARFGDVPPDLCDEIESVVDEKQLKSLVRLAASCPDPDAFRNGVTSRRNFG